VSRTHSRSWLGVILAFHDWIRFFFAGGGCGIGLGLGWGFGLGYGARYIDSKPRFHGIVFGGDTEEIKEESSRTLLKKE
jgi:hypothetical protein